MNYELWKHSEETQDLLKTLKQRIEEVKEDLLDNHQLIAKSSEQVAHEYIYNSGVLRALKEVIQAIEESYVREES